MPLGTIKLNRPISSYAKAQILWGKIIRGKKEFINSKRIEGKKLLNVGCGPYPKPAFINLDYWWNPSIDICWNIAEKKYPLAAESLEGIFTEHCLEHIPYEKCVENIHEFYRLLKPNGTVRIVVPDAEIYFDLYREKKTNKNVVLPYGEEEATGIISINRIFRGHEHLFIYDFETLSMLLTQAGFKEIKKQKFQTGRDERLLIDQREREVESLYVEAVK
jgi:predicted SAM-dependent methyltransferase